MKPNKTFWQRIGMHDWFLKQDAPRKEESISGLTPDQVYHYIIEKFTESIKDLSFAGRVVFYHEYIICFNEADYRNFMANKKGLFGLIVHESIKQFHEILDEYRGQGKLVVPSSRKWVFRFVSHPDYAPGDMGFIGKLLPETNLQKEDNLRVTYIPRQTGIAQTMDINEDILKGFNFYSEGYYELPFGEGGEEPAGAVWKDTTRQAKARLETILPDKAFSGKKLEYLITNDVITVSGSDAPAGEPATFRIPSEWVNTPHLRIRFSATDGKFYLASFGEKTMVNEKVIPRSDHQQPEWSELPLNSRIVLNGIVGINIFKA